ARNCTADFFVLDTVLPVKIRFVIRTGEGSIHLTSGANVVFRTVKWVTNHAVRAVTGDGADCYLTYRRTSRSRGTITIIKDHASIAG
ncbi:hypothetical protein CGJ15_26720, partial [Vibrio parahaemolyticus]